MRRAFTGYGISGRDPASSSLALTIAVLSLGVILSSPSTRAAMVNQTILLSGLVSDALKSPIRLHQPSAPASDVGSANHITSNTNLHVPHQSLNLLNGTLLCRSMGQTP